MGEGGRDGCRSGGWVGGYGAVGKEVGGRCKWGKEGHKWEGGGKVGGEEGGW